MTIRIRPVDLDREPEELLGVLDRNLPDLPHARRFKWIYRDCHLGPAWSWLLWDSESREPVGVASLFRRAVWRAGKVEVCGQVGDFAIDPSHRSLGPALMLQRATFGPVDSGHLALCYDCPPNARGMSTFRRLRMASSATMQRHTRLLRTDRQIARYLELERFGGFQVDHQLELRRLLDRQIAGFRALEDLVHVCGGTPEQVGTVWPIGHKTASVHEFRPIEYRRQAALYRKARDPF